VGLWKKLRPGTPLVESVQNWRVRILWIDEKFRLDRLFRRQGVSSGKPFSQINIRAAFGTERLVVRIGFFVTYGAGHYWGQTSLREELVTE